MSSRSVLGEAVHAGESAAAAPCRWPTPCARNLDPALETWTH